nr:hypothetical protein [Rickettsia endosymbiont of Ceutorhynchus assimilis]
MSAFGVCRPRLRLARQLTPSAENESLFHLNTQYTILSLEAINDKITKDERREIVEFVCQKSNVRLLEMICQRENKDKGGSSNVGVKYRWKGTFTGYSKLIDLLQYVIDNRYSPEIVLFIVKKIYGYAHILCNGKQYLDRAQAGNIKVNFGYQDLVIKKFLKQAIKLGYKDAVLIMLSGDIYHCICLVNWQKFQ